jgi:AcrR family transcriptional regulator
MEGRMTDVMENRVERRRRKAERPQEILEAAFHEFSRNGYAQTTLDQIAERAGVTKGTIYVYFESKEHLFFTMVRDLTKVKFDAIEDMFHRHEGSTVELLRTQFSYIYRDIVEDHRRREVVRMLIAEAPRFPALVDRYYEEIHRPCVELLKQAIQRGIDSGEIRPSAVTECPLVIIAPIALLDVWMMMFGERYPLDMKSYFNAHLELAINGLKAEPTARG